MQYIADLFAAVMGVDNIDIFSLTATTATPAFTWNFGPWAGGNSSDMNGFVPTNGDKIIWPTYDGGFGANSQVPGGFSTATPYYAVNVSGNSFDLAATPGGARIPVTSSMVSYSPNQTFGLVAAAPSRTGIGAGYPDPSSYLSIFRGSMNYMIAVGVAGLGPIVTDTATRFNHMLSLLGVSEKTFYSSGSGVKNAIGSSF